MNCRVQTPAAALGEIMSKLPENEQRSLLSYAITYARLWYPAALVSAPVPPSPAPHTRQKPDAGKTIHDDLANVIDLAQRRPRSEP